jgi:DNA repair protein RecN (Recombination protein N)
MLRNLTIRDFVIVDRLDLEFEGGFTALTGETGAGKSILIDALALVLGERNDAGVVREGCARAEIGAEFALDKLPEAAKWLAENDLAEDGGTCLLRRVLESGGRSRAYVNGRPCTLQQVKELGEKLVDIHGQHEHQSLVKAPAQRALLDAFGATQSLAAEVEGAWRAWQQLRKQRMEFEKDAAALAAERERLEWRAQELGKLAFTPGEWETLQSDHGRLAHAAALIETVEQSLEVLSEGEGTALAAVNGTISRLQAAREYDASVQEILDALEPAQIQLQEAVYGLRHYRQRIELDPGRLREVEQRLETVHSAARKYRVSPEELPALLEETTQRLEQLREGASVEALEKKEKRAADAYLALGRKLSRERERAAHDLSEKVSQAMQTLAMAGGRFEIRLEPLPEGSARGLENIEFMVAAHAGSSPRPLAKVASGGELSRLSLAIQTVTSAVAEVPVLIFDEVDSGIGGRVAEIVGRMLKQLGKRHQVMCITHLPQVAAAADHQWQVAKRSTKGVTMSSVSVLERSERVEEIARMLGGVKITDTTRKHAAEMLGIKA